METPFRVSFLPRAFVAMLFVGLVGCVPYQQYEMTKNERDRLKSTNDDLVAKYNTAIQKILSLEKNGVTNEAAAAKIANLEEANRELLARLKQQVNNNPFTQSD